MVTNMASKRYALFGSEAEFCLDIPEILSGPILRDAYALSLRLQKIFSLYDKSSELSRINRLRSVKASPEMLEVLNAALELCRLSNGEYDISLGRQFMQRKSNQAVTKAGCSYRDIAINGDYVKLLNDEAMLDLGSIAKGYIAECACDFLASQGVESGYVDARGDIRVFGDQREVGVMHPRNCGLISAIRLENMGVATSGDYMQFNKSFDESHIINNKELISATAVSGNLMNADSYATAIMVSSKDCRESLIRRLGCPAMTVDRDLNIMYYNGFEGLKA